MLKYEKNSHLHSDFFYKRNCMICIFFVMPIIIRKKAKQEEEMINRFFFHIITSQKIFSNRNNCAQAPTYTMHNIFLKKKSFRLKILHHSLNQIE